MIFFNKNISGKKYLNAFAAYSSILLFIVILINIKGLFFDDFLGNHLLYTYQLNKIKNEESVETIFVGDSSLGNSIDAEYFSKLSGGKSLNLSLTGSYGFAGSYNMIKKSISLSVKNVVLMQTLDMFKRPTSYSGYLFTLGSFGGIEELTANEKVKLWTAFYTLILSPGNLKPIVKNYLGIRTSRSRIENDYIKQEGKLRIKAQLNAGGINKDKIRFLKKMIMYCSKNGINFIHIHGPILDKVGINSAEYINEVNNFLLTNNIRNINNVTLIEEEHLGNREDHVSAKYKKHYTEKYFRLLKPHLKIEHNKDADPAKTKKD